MTETSREALEYAVELREKQDVIFMKMGKLSMIGTRQH